VWDEKMTHFIAHMGKCGFNIQAYIDAEKVEKKVNIKIVIINRRCNLFIIISPR
jgi:hypothetical protein